MSAPGYLPRQITAITGIPYSTLNHWAKKGFITPSICAGKGTGNERIYSAEDLRVIKMAHTLKRVGFGTDIIRLAISKLRKYPGTDCVELEIGARRELIRISILTPPGETPANPTNKPA